MKARDITRAIMKNEKTTKQAIVPSQNAGNVQDDLMCTSDTGDDVASQNSGVTVTKAGLKKLKGVRSLSIQNNSTKVSSFSDTNSEENNTSSGKNGTSGQYRAKSLVVNDQLGSQT